jgi:DNA-directed RNA polymerase alpha subunit
LATQWPGRLRIDWTSLPPRTRSLLINAGFATIGEVAAKTDAELLALPGFGQKTLRLVRAEIKRLGVAEDRPQWQTN